MKELGEREIEEIRFAAEEVVADENEQPGDWHPRTVYLAKAVLRLLAERPEMRPQC